MPAELFADNASTTVSSGGTTAPAAGTSESWTVASSAGFPAASSSATPQTAFRVVDPAQPTEWMLVTNVSGTTWTVTRGIEGATATHTAGFTVQQVVTAGWLNANGGLDQRGGQVNVRQVYGCKGDGKTVTDGAMTSGSATLTSATAGFTAADVGKSITVASATSTAMTLACKIASVTNATTAVLTVPARVGASGLTMVLDGIRTVADAVTTNNSTTVTSATMAFVATDVGSVVTVATAGRVALNTTISGFTNSTTVTLAASATRTCTASSVTYGTDDSAAIIAAFAGAAAANPGSLYFPGGMYLCKPFQVGGGVTAMNIPANTRITGDGWNTIIRSVGGESTAGNVANGLWGINMPSGGTTDPAANTVNVILENLHFQGTVTEEGFLENGCNLLVLSACSDVVVRACKFSNCRSDGIYLGSSMLGATERHNERIRVEDCTFDGINNDNRNGISVIDGSDVSITRCSFLNFARSNMPGAIDCEPNDYPFPRIRGIRIDNCYFTNIGGNAGIVGMFLSTPQPGYTYPFQGFSVTNSVFFGNLSSSLGILLQQPNFPDDTYVRNDVIISGNVFRGDTGTNTGLSYCMEIEGIRGAVISNNTWDVSQQSLIIGYTYKCLDIDIVNNVFKDVSGVGAKGVELVKADRVRFEGNTFDHVSPVTGGGVLLRFANGGAISTPSGVVATPSNTGGTLTAAHGAYGYRVSAFMDNGNNTVASTEVTATIASGTAGSIALSWPAVYGAKGYNVYGRTTAGELLMTPTGQTATTFTDTGSVTPSGALPTAATSNGGSNGVVFAGNTIRQGSSNNLAAIASVAAGHTTVASALEYYWNRVPNNNTALTTITPFVDDRWADNYGPMQHNLLAWTFDPNLCDGATGGQLLASGTLYLTKLHMPRAALVTNILMYVSTVGATLTAGQSFACLYDAAGNLLATTSSQSSLWTSTGLKTMALASTYAGNPGDYYVGAWSVGTTPPTFAGWAGVFGAVGADAAAANMGLATPNLRAATSSTGRTTTAPNPFGAQTAIGKVIWAALS